MFPLESRLHTYFANYSLQPISGVRYRLDVYWHGKQVTGETRVPFPPEIVYLRKDSVTQIRSDVSLTSVTIAIRPRAGECYGVEFMTVDSLGSWGLSYPGSNTVRTISDTSVGGLIEFPLVGKNLRGDSLVASVSAYDSPFKELVRSYYSDIGEIEAFGNGSDGVKWNIEGDGVGFIIGRAAASQGIR